MFHLSENSTLRGYGHVILNIFRAFNVIGLLTICASSWVLIVMTGLTNNFFFFDAASHFFTSTIAIFLIISELNLFKRYFERNWPVLSPSHGLSWLGIGMVIMGCQVLGNLNKPSDSPENLGLPLWRLVLASGILSITFGFFNIVSSIIFRDGRNQINSRTIRTDGSLASAKSYTDGYSTRSASVSKREKPAAYKRWTQKFGIGAKAGGDDGGAATRGRPNISHPIISHPMPVHQDDGESGYDRRSPIVPDIQRPNTALHPMNTGVSRYSEASHLPRF